MPFISKTYKLKEDIPAYLFLIREFKLSMKQAQSWVSKARIIHDDKTVLKANQKISNEVQVIKFEGFTKGLTPMYENPYFAIFEKPQELLVHPKNIHTQYSLLDEVRYHFGDDANLAHRIDSLTSGLVLVSKSKKYEKDLKQLFDKKDIQKEYQVVVKGEIRDSIIIDQPIKINPDLSTLKEKMIISQDGKKSITKIKPIFYDKVTNTTNLIAKPITGRTHQIRVHLNSINHPIIGEPLYGVDFEIADRYLDDKLSKQQRIKYLGSDRLMLHAYKLSFSFKNRNYKITSINQLF